MDFEFDPQQVALRDVARRFLGDRCPSAFVRRTMDDPLGHSSATWSEMAELGFQGVAIPSRYGGTGLGLVEAAILHDELAWAGLPSPYFATVVLVATVLAAAGGPHAERHLPRIVRGTSCASLAWIEPSVSWGPGGVQLLARPDGGSYILDGSKVFVPYAHVADVLLVAARTSSGTPGAGVTLFALERDQPGMTIQPMIGYDRANRMSLVRLEGARVSADAVVGEVDRGWSMLEVVLQRAAVLASAEMLGASRRCLEMTVDYAKVRQQFGQPIGSFQAVKHTCANMLVDVENSHIATYYAAWAQDAGAPDARLAASVAKAYVSDASREVTSCAIQMHGGIGVTWDLDLHLFFKRAKYFEPLYGNADFHRERALRESLALKRATSEAT